MANLFSAIHFPLFTPLFKRMLCQKTQSNERLPIQHPIRRAQQQVQQQAQGFSPLVALRQSGFTLIELVVTIVIITVLAIVAAPKLINLARDANIAQLHQLAAQIQSQNKLAYNKSSIDDISHLEGCSYQCNGHPNWDVLAGEFFIGVSGTRLYVSLGYPLPPLASGVEANYRAVFGLPEEDYAFTAVMPHQAATAIVPIKWQDKLAKIRNGTFECHVEYSSPTNIREYSVKVFSKDC
ncbi:type II secretion system protein [Shewanella waksmanii]|uniref:type II secretion system protein n=1 Tax=Shewanella waksmanii TaxID=213783 RepID=UPI003736D8A9